MFNLNKNGQVILKIFVFTLKEHLKETVLYILLK